MQPIAVVTLTAAVYAEVVLGFAAGAVASWLKQIGSIQANTLLRLYPTGQVERWAGRHLVPLFQAGEDPAVVGPWWQRAVEAAIKLEAIAPVLIEPDPIVLPYLHWISARHHFARGEPILDAAGRWLIVAARPTESLLAPLGVTADVVEICYCGLVTAISQRTGHRVVLAGDLEHGTPLESALFYGALIDAVRMTVGVGAPAPVLSAPAPVALPGEMPVAPAPAPATPALPDNPELQALLEHLQHEGPGANGVAKSES